MTDQGMSVRLLARTWRPNADIEVTRRSLNRYLTTHGVVPGQAIRRELAAALGVNPLELELDDDEEVDLSSAVMNLVAALRREIAFSA